MEQHLLIWNMDFGLFYSENGLSVGMTELFELRNQCSKNIKLQANQPGRVNQENARVDDYFICVHQYGISGTISC